MTTLEEVTKNINSMKNTAWAGVVIGLTLPIQMIGIGAGLWAGSAIAAIKYYTDSCNYNPIIRYQGSKK
jgi:hypothetical protein